MDENWGYPHPSAFCNPRCQGVPWGFIGGSWWSHRIHGEVTIWFLDGILKISEDDRFLDIAWRLDDCLDKILKNLTCHGYWMIVWICLDKILVTIVSLGLLLNENLAFQISIWNHSRCCKQRPVVIRSSSRFTWRLIWAAIVFCRKLPYLSSGQRLGWH